MNVPYSRGAAGNTVAAGLLTLLCASAAPPANAQHRAEQSPTVLASALITRVATPAPAHAAESEPSAEPPATGAPWKVNTHLFAANLALADALDDGRVTIPPYGEFAVRPGVFRALRRFQTAYRAGVIGPDAFPDIYVGQAVAHVDHAARHNGWTSDGWLRHVFEQAHAWGEPGAERDRAVAFAYGYLTHAAGDVFGHTYINLKAGGAWDFQQMDVVQRHVVLEGYIGKHTPPTDVTIEAWPRFVAESLIKHPRARAHTLDAPHYRRFLQTYDWVGAELERAKREMGDDGTYAVRCLSHPDACARKEYLETWHRDIDGGLRRLVAANQRLGEAILEDKPLEGISALSSWQSEWLPKMFGAHVVGELANLDLLAPITEPIKEEVIRWLKKALEREIEILKMITDPASYMDQVFAPAARAQIRAEMAMGPDSLVRWREFEALYNTVVLSKLVLLDGRALNELARRAGVSRPLYPEDVSSNIMLAVVRSMDGDHQWDPESDYAMPYRAYRPPGPSSKKGTVKAPGTELNLAVLPSGFPFWGDAEAREKVFGRIFKGYGPGPGIAVPTRVRPIRIKRPDSPPQPGTPGTSPRNP